MRVALVLGVALLLAAACVPAAETPAGETVQPGEGVSGGRTDEVAPTETTDEQVGGEDPLAGSEWALIGYGPEGALMEVPAGVQVTLRFEDGQVGGTAACNSYFGSYQIAGETLEVGPIGMTEMWCEGLMELESTYLGMLGTAGRYRLSADELVLETAEGALVFGQPEAAAAVPITGTVWVLDTIVSGDTAQSVLAGTRLTLELNDGKAAGETGCNYYGADYTLEGSAFSIGLATITVQGCGDEIMAQEALYMSMLGTARGLRLEGGRLVIDTADGELVFKEGDDLALEGTVWVLQGIATAEAIVQTWIDEEITAEFVGGQILGGAGCNSYFASYELEGGALTLGPVGSTMTACEEERMDREGEFLAALAEVAGYTIELDELTLMDANGKALLVFKPSQDRPLEGITWALGGIAQEQAMVSTWVDAEITAEFAAGQVSGNAGCNSYFASYELEGAALTLGPVGSTMMMCDQEHMDREGEFLAALAEVAGYTIALDELTLMDANGRALLIFKPSQGRPLEGTTWALGGIAQEEAMVSTWVDAEITAEFAAGQVSGGAGCNQYFASYETDGSALHFGPVGRTEMACADAERMEREEAFLAALADVAGFQIKMDVLTLLDAEGNPLVVFTAAD
jgi:heat shock protein HslJ